MYQDRTFGKKYDRIVVSWQLQFSILTGLVCSSSFMFGENFVFL